MVKLNRVWVGALCFGGCLSAATGCSDGGQPSESQAVMDRDTVKSIAQPLYGGNTAIDSTTSTGAIGRPRCSPSMVPRRVAQAPW